MTVIRFRHATIIRLTLLVVSMIVLVPAHAALESLEISSYELDADQIMRWPLRVGDSLIVRACSGCDTETLRVTDETDFEFWITYLKNEKDKEKIKLGSLRDLLKEKSRLRRRDNYLIVIFFDPDNHRLDRIALDTVR